MPSLMPGMPGTKEAYGLSRIREDLSLQVPPKALARYRMEEGDRLLLMTTHIGEGGFVAMRREDAESSVFARFASRVDSSGRVVRIEGKSYAESLLRDGKIALNEAMLEAFLVRRGDELMSVKSTTIALSFAPKEIWMRKFAERGLDEAAGNIAGLDIF